MKIGFFILIAIFLFKTEVTFSQGELDDDDKSFYRNERSTGLFLNTNGWGLGYRWGKRLDGYRKRLIEIDAVGIKHPKEIKTHNPYFENNQKRFVFGKLNSFYDLRFGYGRQKEIFGKFDKGGISIIRYYMLGASVGLLMPIYYEVLYRTNQSDEYIIVVEKFNPSIHKNYDIYGKAPFYTGLNETAVVPGLFLNYGVSFEYSNVDRRLRALEAGIILEAFWKKIEIMATEENNRFFVSLYISVRIGKIIGR